MLLNRRPLLSRRFLFFGGKGGVGKTTLAAGFALLAAERGNRTLLVSTDAAHSAGDILEAGLGSDPREVTADLWAMEIDPAREADQYISDVKARIVDATPPRIAGEVERQIDIARVTPGAEESALFERFTRILEAEGERFDRIVFDTAPLGHTLRLFSLPEQMASWMNALIGRRRKVNALNRMWLRVAGTVGAERGEPVDPVEAALEERVARFRRAREILTDSDRTAFVFVLIPERLPIIETERAARALERHGIPIAAVIVNRVLPENAGGEFLRERRARQGRYTAMIDERFSRYPTYRIPLFASDVVGREAMLRIVESQPDTERLNVSAARARERLP
ncbi:MAG: ArsA family ATPase [Gemmatimonadales bacterium]